MSSRAAALLVKDLRQHAAVVALATVGLALAWLLFLLATLSAPTTVSYTEVHVTFLRVALVPFALALGNRLVVAELYGRTQRFLEALPMGRLEPFAVKWLLGASILLSVALGSAVASLAVASLREPVDAGLTLSLLSRTVVFCLTIWAFFFTMGQLGKLRIPLYLALGLVAVILAETTELELLRFGPIALVGPDFATSRIGVPWTEVATSLATMGAFLAVGLAMALVREGSVQEALAKPMSSRERAMVGIATCTILTIWAGLAPEPEPEPYRMQGEHVLAGRDVPLRIGYGGPENRAAAEALRARLESSLAALRDAMGWRALPECRVVMRASLDGRTFEAAELRAGDGALVRANFAPDAEPDLEGLEAALVRALFDDRTNRRARFEPQAWVRAGFPLWWAHCRNALTESRCSLSVERRALAQLALDEAPAGPKRVTSSRIAAWDTLREREGERIAESLAATGMMTLARLAGPDAPTRLARALFSRWAPDDSRVVFETLLRPPSWHLRAIAGVEPEAFHRAWDADLAADRARSEIAAWLERVSPRPTARLDVVTAEASQRTLVIDIEVPWRRTEGVVVGVLTKALLPFDTVVEPWELRRDRFVLGPNEHTRRIELAGRVSRGERWLVVVEVEDPREGPGAPVRVLAERREIP